MNSPAKELRAAAVELRKPLPTYLVGAKIRLLQGGGEQMDVLAAREPLARLLDDLADEAEAIDASEVTLGPDAMYDTGVADDRGELRPDLTHARAIARAILGGGRG